jgi:hypothetical protein
MNVIICNGEKNCDGSDTELGEECMQAVHDSFQICTG